MDYIILSSKKRATGYTPTKFRIQLKDPIVGKYWLCHAIIPNTSPALRSTGLVIKIASTESTVFVNPAGVYTAAQAVTALQTALNGVSNIFTVTQDASTHRLNVARTGTATVDFYPRWFKAASTLSSQLGLFSNLQISGSSGSSVSFDGPLQLAAPLAYRIRLNNHSRFEDTNGTLSTFYIPCTANSFDIITYSSDGHDKQFITFKKPTKAVDLELLGVDGQLNQLADWEIVLKRCGCSEPYVCD